MTERQKILDEVFESAVENEMKYFGCSQAVLGALHKVFEEVSVDVLKAGTGLAGGVARQGQTCGALIAAIMAIGAVAGRGQLEDMEKYQKAMIRCMELYNVLRDRVGHTNCSEIQRVRFGKVYRFYIPEELEAFMNEGGHDRNGCPEVCGIIARAAAELILEIKGA